MFTITGDPDACRRRARDIAAQLRSAGLDVTVVGRVLGDDVPTGCRHTDMFPATAGAAARPEAEREPETASARDARAVEGTGRPR